MKKTLPVIFGIIILLLFIYVKWSGSEPALTGEQPAFTPQFVAPATNFPLNVELKVALVVGEKDAGAVAAYEQILAEEGFPYEVVPADTLSNFTPGKLAEQYVALIIPEETGRNITPSLAALCSAYVQQAGGKIFLGTDTGTVDQRGMARERGLLSNLAGLQYHIPGPEEKMRKGNIFVPGNSPLRKYFDPGLFERDMLKIFDYPAVKTPFLPISGVTADILAYTGPQFVPENGFVMQKKYPGGGVVLYVNGAPGLLKIRENVDFVLRGLLKYFLLDLVGLPRLVASPGGTAGLVLSMHVCSGAYFRDLDRILALKLLAGEIPFSIFVTAGPDNDRPGDKRGVDVLNARKGRPYIEALGQYGNIGAHGGWIHNYWAYHFGELSDQQKEDFINLNYQALEKVTGERVSVYAAPGGAHDPVVNDFLAALGTKAAAIPLAFNSPPTHAWFNGRPEKRFWLFGYTGLTYGTAFENMLAGGKKPAEIEQDMVQLIDSMIPRREIRQIYFHPVSIARHPGMWRNIQGHVLKHVGEGNLTVRTMNDFTDFLNRHERVHFSVRETGKGYFISAWSPVSLKEMTFALPLGKSNRVRVPAGTRIKEMNGWAYVTINKDANRMAFLVPVVKKKVD
ncbi:polysaccharide deacetylase family protein [Desulfofundulus thermobenzoicus]|uniref:Polysaccharide deacetylase family protein n=1 Tax=Desulfofundulus thermobenzoicus TaxID=29376 RepID=A0A6N7ISA8_9FIRM|nr:polysaccharide deacetylase family protein [Desulfofundulus thermobenzoicus]MQL52337.1 polysaccharide deacetylase family protein [Desulfofundulus thermobenzoicus]HHW42258.1 polysaccharide deacetylase family protein [Desulfotomaculum sp.]